MKLLCYEHCNIAAFSRAKKLPAHVNVQMTKRKEDIKEFEKLLKLGKRKANEVLPVFVVEDHNEALTAIYKAIRRGLLPLHNISMMHFDAHPDLSVPKGIPARMVFDDPEEMMHRLRNSGGGIAEWIAFRAIGRHRVICVVW